MVVPNLLPRTEDVVLTGWTPVSPAGGVVPTAMPGPDVLGLPRSLELTDGRCGLCPGELLRSVVAPAAGLSLAVGAALFAAGSLARKSKTLRSLVALASGTALVVSGLTFAGLSCIGANFMDLWRKMRLAPEAELALNFDPRLQWSKRPELRLLVGVGPGCVGVGWRGLRFFSNRTESREDVLVPYVSLAVALWGMECVLLRGDMSLTGLVLDARRLSDRLSPRIFLGALLRSRPVCGQRRSPPDVVRGAVGCDRYLRDSMSGRWTDTPARGEGVTHCGQVVVRGGSTETCWRTAPFVDSWLVPGVPDHEGVCGWVRGEVSTPGPVLYRWKEMEGGVGMLAIYEEVGGFEIVELEFVGGKLSRNSKQVLQMGNLSGLRSKHAGVVESGLGRLEAGATWYADIVGFVQSKAPPLAYFDLVPHDLEPVNRSWTRVVSGLVTLGTRTRGLKATVTSPSGLGSRVWGSSLFGLWGSGAIPGQMSVHTFIEALEKRLCTAGLPSKTIDFTDEDLLAFLGEIHGVRGNDGRVERMTEIEFEEDVRAKLRLSIEQYFGEGRDPDAWRSWDPPAKAFVKQELLLVDKPVRMIVNCSEIRHSVIGPFVRAIEHRVADRTRKCFEDGKFSDIFQVKSLLPLEVHTVVRGVAHQMVERGGDVDAMMCFECDYSTFDQTRSTSAALDWARLILMLVHPSVYDGDVMAYLQTLRRQVISGRVSLHDGDVRFRVLRECGLMSGEMDTSISNLHLNQLVWWVLRRRLSGLGIRIHFFCEGDDTLILTSCKFGDEASRALIAAAISEVVREFGFVAKVMCKPLAGAQLVGTSFGPQACAPLERVITKLFTTAHRLSCDVHRGGYEQDCAGCQGRYGAGLQFIAARYLAYVTNYSDAPEEFNYYCAAFAVACGHRARVILSSPAARRAAASEIRLHQASAEWQWRYGLAQIELCHAGSDKTLVVDLLGLHSGDGRGVFVVGGANPRIGRQTYGEWMTRHCVQSGCLPSGRKLDNEMRLDGWLYLVAGVLRNTRPGSPSYERYLADRFGLNHADASGCVASACVALGAASGAMYQGKESTIVGDCVATLLSDAVRLKVAPGLSS